MSESTERVVNRYLEARELSDREFDQLMKWLGPRAHAAHKKYPRGRRYFNTHTRVFSYNFV